MQVQVSIGRAKNIGLIQDGPFITPNLLYMSQNGANQSMGMSLTNRVYQEVYTLEITSLTQMQY